VALAGTKTQAEEWLDWVGRLLRRGFESSLEAPVSLRRVHGLLAVRAGKSAAAGKQFALAARGAAAEGFVSEAALTELQSHELRIRLGVARENAGYQSRARVAELGFDPMPHLYSVHSACDAGAAKVSAILTPREREVLKQLAAGRTYKESAENLGVAWKTVQTQAHRIYEKLSVGNRTEAITEGRRLGLI
jgi:DNA-binding CsgD family transcriptional regulator